MLTWHLMDRRCRSPVEPGFRGASQPSRRAGARSGTCGRRKELHRRLAKTFQSRFGLLSVLRTYYVCRPCGDGHFPLDRALGLEGKSATPGAESIHADAASSDSYEAAVRKLGNLAGVKVTKATLRRHCVRIGEEVQAFEREDVEPEAPSADRVLVEIDGTGVPMVASEVEGVPGKQADGTAKTCEAKVIVRYRASRDPKTGAPRKDKDSRAVSVRIDSAKAVDVGPLNNPTLGNFHAG